MRGVKIPAGLLSGRLVLPRWTCGDLHAAHRAVTEGRTRARSRRAGRSLLAGVGAVGLVTAAAVMAAPAPSVAMPTIVHPARLSTSDGVSSSTDRSASWASSNWSGYAEAGTFTSVTGGWTVPTVTSGASTVSRGGSGFGGRGSSKSSTSAWYSAGWLGIDGYNNSDLIQTGTEQDYYSGSAHYSAWWEILPAAETTISKPVSPGDSMTASITKTSTQVTIGTGGRHGRTTTEYEWQIILKDVTQNWSFTTTQTYSGPGTSAEWIVEAPEVNGQIASLPTYLFPGSAASAGDLFGADVATTLGGALTGAGLNYTDDAGVMIQNNAQVSTPGQPDPAETAFNSSYGSTVPAAPTS